MTDAQERRTDPRIPTEGLDIQVVDALDGTLLGSLANLSQNGLLLNSAEPFAEGASYQVELRWQDDSGEHRLALGVHALWSSAGPAASAWTGFQIIDISDADRLRLQALLEVASS